MILKVWDVTIDNSLIYNFPPPCHLSEGHICKCCNRCSTFIFLMVILHSWCFHWYVWSTFIPCLFYFGLRILLTSKKLVVLLLKSGDVNFWRCSCTNISLILCTDLVNSSEYSWVIYEKGYSKLNKLYICRFPRSVDVWLTQGSNLNPSGCLCWSSNFILFGFSTKIGWNIT